MIEDYTDGGAVAAEHSAESVDSLVGRAQRLFQFLTHVQELKRTPVRHLSSYEHEGFVVWLHDVPLDGAVTLAGRTGNIPGSPDEPLLILERAPRLAPPDVPDDLIRWIAGRVDDPEKEPAFKDRVVVSVEHDKNLAADGAPPVETIALSDHPDISDRLLSWLLTWSEWAEREREIRPVRKLYDEIFRMHNDLQYAADQWEAVVGLCASACLLLTLGTGLLFGTLPALQTSRVRAFGALQAGIRAGRSGIQRRLSGLLVAGEVALAVMLVVGATLLIRSFWELRQVDLGFQAEELITATVAPPEFRFSDPPARAAFYRDLLDRMGALPGVRGVAATDRLPFGTQGWGSVFIIEGRPDPATEGGEWPWASIAGAVSEGYFAEMGIPILEGRSFGPEDREDAPPVAIVSQGLAREFWPGESPVDRRIRSPGGEWITIVGVAADSRARAVAGDTDTALYRPLAQSDPAVLSVILRTSLPPEAMLPTVREAVRGLDRDTPVEDVRSMGQLVSGSVAGERTTMFLLSAFAGAALLLGALGIYGVLAYSVNERRSELGLRMALGARGGDILRLVLRQGALLAGAGVVLGLTGAAAGSRILSSLVFGVSTTDPITFLVVPAILIGVAGLACYFPARKATRVEPLTVLKAD